MISIDTPLPLVSENDAPWCLSAEMLNLLARKVNALSNMRAISPIKLTKTDAGFVFHTGKSGLLPEGTGGAAMPDGLVPGWQQISVCVNGVPTTYYVYAGSLP
jgi:hypothetical protein